MHPNENPIGIFDSGLGGLSALKEIRRILPRENMVYFGDTARIPYGTRSAETVKRYALSDMRFLMTKHPKAIVIACGTVSSTALDECRSVFDGPVIGVIEPACKTALLQSENRKIGVIATASTVKSGAFQKTLSEMSDNVTVVAVPCPLFVPLVENGFVSPEDPVPLEIARRYLKPIREAGCDVLILGCTHYPHLSGVISRILPGVALVDTGAEVAGALFSVLEERELSRSGEGEGTLSLYVSDDKEGFENNGEPFLGEKIAGKVEQIHITPYCVNETE